MKSPTTTPNLSVPDGQINGASSVSVVGRVILDVTASLNRLDHLLSNQLVELLDVERGNDI